MKEEKYFNYKRNRHIVLKQLKKSKVIRIKDTSNIDDSKIIN